MLLLLLFYVLFQAECAEFFVDGISGSNGMNGTDNNDCMDQNYPCRTILHISWNLCDVMEELKPNIIHFLRGEEHLWFNETIECENISEIKGPDEPNPIPSIIFHNYTTMLDVDDLVVRRVRFTGRCLTLSIEKVYDSHFEYVQTFGPIYLGYIYSSTIEHHKSGEDGGNVALFSIEAHDSTFFDVHKNVFGNMIEKVENCDFIECEEVFYVAIDVSPPYTVTNSRFYRNGEILEQKIRASKQLNKYVNCQFINNTDFGSLDGGDLVILDSEIVFHWVPRKKKDTPAHYLKIKDGSFSLKNTNVTMLFGDGKPDRMTGVYIEDGDELFPSNLDVVIGDLAFQGDNFNPIQVNRETGKKASIGLARVGFSGHPMTGVKVSGSLNTLTLTEVYEFDDCGCKGSYIPFECDKDAKMQISDTCQFEDHADYESLYCSNEKKCVYTGTAFDSIVCPTPKKKDDKTGEKVDKNEGSTILKNVLTVVIVVLLFTCAACYLIVLLVVGIILGVMRCWYVRKHKSGDKYRTLEEEIDDDDDDDALGLGDEVIGETSNVEGDTNEEDEIELADVNDIELLD